MRKIVRSLGWSIAICLVMGGKGYGTVTPLKGPIPQEAVEIYTKDYRCEDWEAPLGKVTDLLEEDIILDWLDIVPFISDAHIVQGFVDIFLTLEIGEIEGVDKPDWYMRGDFDDQGENDIRAYCNGAFYDLIDTDFKSFTYNIFDQNAEDGEYIILRFGLPPVIGGAYKVYLGEGQVGLQSTPSDYTNYSRIKFYIRPVHSLPIAHVDIAGIPTTFESQTPIKRVIVNTPITFDCSKSIDSSGNKIILYELDVDNNIDPGIDVVNYDPLLTYVYKAQGLKKVVLTVNDDKGNYSRNDGDPRANVSSAPLPLWVQVDSALTGEAKLYQCAPHPYIPAQCPITRIKYKILKSTHVTIKIYTYAGDLVKTLVDEQKNVGEWLTSWDCTNEAGRKTAAGIYFYCMEAGNYKKIKRMVVIK